MIYLLLILLITLLILIYFLDGKTILIPSFAFTASFAFATLWAAIYAKQWLLNLHTNTFIIILLGNYEFAIICHIIHKILKRKSVIRYNTKPVCNEIQSLGSSKGIIKIDTFLLDIYLLFSIISLLIIGLNVIRISGGSISDLSGSLNKYRIMTQWYGSDILPIYVRLLKQILGIGALWFLYVFINNLIIEKKVNGKLLIVIIISLISTLFTGARGALIDSIVEGVVIYLILFIKNDKRNNKLKWNTILKISFIFILLLFSFQILGDFLGRGSISDNVRTSIFDYLALYCGAPIKNLDTVLQVTFPKNTFVAKATLYSFNNFILSLLGLPDYKIKLYSLNLTSFRFVNGIALGNVYSTFFAFYYDFKFGGVVLFVGIMAFISQMAYEKVKNTSLSMQPRLVIIIYSLMYNALLQSLFDNKFYTILFSDSFLQIIIIYFFLNFFFARVRYKIK